VRRSKCFQHEDVAHFSRFSFAVVSALLLVCSLSAKDHHKAAPPEDQIEVIAHLPLNGATVTRFLSTQHYRRNYLYAESASGKTVTMIDVTDAAKPALLADVASAPAAGDVVMAAGTAALISTSDHALSISAQPQTFRIMSFADPAHPVVSQEFPNVSAVARDDKRSLIFLANGQGLWILREKLAMDPEFEKEWEHMMLDNR